MVEVGPRGCGWGRTTLGGQQDVVVRRGGAVGADDGMFGPQGQSLDGLRMAA